MGRVDRRDLLERRRAPEGQQPRAGEPHLGPSDQWLDLRRPGNHLAQLAGPEALHQVRPAGGQQLHDLCRLQPENTRHLRDGRGGIRDLTGVASALQPLEVGMALGTIELLRVALEVVGRREVVVRAEPVRPRSQKMVDEVEPGPLQQTRRLQQVMQDVEVLVDEVVVRIGADPHPALGPEHGSVHDWPELGALERDIGGTPGARCRGGRDLRRLGRWRPSAYQPRSQPAGTTTQLPVELTLTTRQWSSLSLAFTSVVSRAGR